MKCKSCGAEIKVGKNVCEYCGSSVEREIPKIQTIIHHESSVKSVVGTIGKVIIALAGIGAVLMVITLVIILNSDTIKKFSNDPLYANAVHEIPQSKIGLTAHIISYDKKGFVSVEYERNTYENIKILDEDLIKWLNETDRSLNGVEICFSTDENGDILDLGLLSENFFIIAKEGERYIAIRDGEVISFTSAIPVGTERYYSGYFSYPDLYLYSQTEQKLLGLTYLDPKCDDKESTIEQEYYTGEDVSVYKISVDRKWYYCSKEVYDSIQVGDLLNGYRMYEDREMAFIVEQ